MPGHHAVTAADVSTRRLHAALCAAADVGPRAYPDLLLVPGVGARTVEALALVAEVIHGAPCRFRDPARFSYAHGGKDGVPFPVPLAVYDRTIGVLKEAVTRARLGQDDRLAALRELDRQSRALEPVASGPPAEALFARERERAAELGGRTVFGRSGIDRTASPPVSGAASRSARKVASPSAQLGLPGLAPPRR